MTQTELNHAIARATGDSIATIARMGFVQVSCEPVPRNPPIVDWDELNAQRPALFPRRTSRQSGRV